MNGFLILHNLYSFRYPLPLQNGMQCKIIQGFGNTICKRLDEKLREHKLKQSNNLDIPVSPVLLPQGQVPRSSPTKSTSPSSFKSQEEKDLELALELSQQETSPQPNVSKRNYSEEDDYQFALQLSQQEEDPPEANESQEELDRQFALKLQEEFNKEAAPPPVVHPPSPPRVPFTFDSEIERADRDYVCDDDLPDIPDLPDLSLSAPPRSSSLSRSEHKAGPSKPKKVARTRVTHDISVISDEEDDNPGLLNNNPTKSSRSKSQTPSKSPGRKEYVPRHGTGAYAVLLTLHQAWRNYTRRPK